MGVDISVDVGVGFVLDPDVLMKFLDENDPDREGVDDVVDRILRGRPLLTSGTGGSYYDDGKDNRTWIAVRRLHKSHEMHDIPGGVFGLNKPVITLEERRELEQVAAEFRQNEIEIGQFLSVLWH